MAIIEKTNGVHINEQIQRAMGKTTAQKYSDHCKLDSDFCASNNIIDTNKRGKAADISDGREFKLLEPSMTE